MQPPQQNNVILLGSSARAATASAGAAGLHVTAVDAFGDADLRAMCQRYYPLSSDAFPSVFLRSLEPSTLVPLGGCERWIDAIASLKDRHRIAGATEEQWRLLSDVSVLREIARAAAIRFPESHRYPEGPRRGLPSNADPSAPRWLFKMPFSCGGLGVRWSENASIAPGGWFQRWVKGTAIGASYLSTASDVFMLGVCRGLRFRTDAHPAIYAGSCGPLQLSPEWNRKLVRLGRTAARCLQLRGLFNADLILHPVEGLYLLEINPRYSASMELVEPDGAVRSPGNDADDSSDSAHGSSLLAAHLQCFSGPLPKDGWPLAPPRRAADSRQRVRCKRVVFTRQKTVFDASVRRGMEEILKAHSATWADVPVAGTTILGQRPLVSIFTEADSAAAALRKAARVVGAVRQRLARRS